MLVERKTLARTALRPRPLALFFVR